MTRATSIAGAITIAMTPACSGAATGSAQIFIVPESTITEGLDPGPDLENIADGWTIRYHKWVIAVGNFRAHRSSTPDDVLELPDIHVMDLTAVSSGGVVIGELDGIPAERWDKVGYDISYATVDSKKDASVSQDDYDAMVANAYTFMIDATMTKGDGQSCTPGTTDCVDAPQIAFSWALTDATSFDDCASEQGDAGFAVPSGGTVEVEPTIHGDHWFFSNITAGVEITDRRAQWVADCDLDHDGRTTLEELSMVESADIFPAGEYVLTNQFRPVYTALDYVVVQLHTVGDFQGDGDCPTRKILEE